MTTIENRKLKPAARAVLQAARDHHRRIADGDGTIAEKDEASWFRPKEIGGTATNRCGCNLVQLVRRGFVERRDARPGGWRECKLWEYRITPTGLEELERKSIDLMAALKSSLAERSA